jgi:hypothetical protein
MTNRTVGMAAMEQDVARFIRRENVRHYQRLLERATNGPDRQRLLTLLAEEQAKQQAAGDPPEFELNSSSQWTHLGRFP